MKKSDNCSKCNSTDTVIVENNRAENVISLGVFSAVLKSRQICCECGYIEEFVRNKKDLDKIRKKYQ